MPRDPSPQLYFDQLLHLEDRSRVPHVESVLASVYPRTESLRNDFKIWFETNGPRMKVLTIQKTFVDSSTLLVNDDNELVDCSVKAGIQLAIMWFPPNHSQLNFPTLTEFLKVKPLSTSLIASPHIVECLEEHGNFFNLIGNSLRSAICRYLLTERPTCTDNSCQKENFRSSDRFFAGKPRPSRSAFDVQKSMSRRCHETVSSI